MLFHSLNRGVERMRIFATERDYAPFEETIEETLRRYPMRILPYWLMPNIGTPFCGPRQMAICPSFLQRLTNTHTQPAMTVLYSPPQPPRSNK